VLSIERDELEQSPRVETGRQRIDDGDSGARFDQFSDDRRNRGPDVDAAIDCCRRPISSPQSGRCESCGPGRVWRRRPTTIYPSSAPHRTRTAPITHMDSPATVSSSFRWLAPSWLTSWSMAEPTGRSRAFPLIGSCNGAPHDARPYAHNHRAQAGALNDAAPEGQIWRGVESVAGTQGVAVLDKAYGEGLAVIGGFRASGTGHGPGVETAHLPREPLRLRLWDEAIALVKSKRTRPCTHSNRG
jgi:hypothetical protein